MNYVIKLMYEAQQTQLPRVSYGEKVSIIESTT